MIDFKKLTEQLQNMLQNVNVTHDMSDSAYDRVISVRLKDVKFDLADSVPESVSADVLEKLKSYYKKYFNANEKLLFDIYFEDDTTVKIFIPRIINNSPALLQMIRSISC